jgi:hypothetical protein
MGDYRVRFRHAHGDVGPFSFSPLATVEAMKARVKEEWPVGGSRIAACILPSET